MRARFRVGKDREGTYVWDRSIQPEAKELCLIWCIDTQELEIYQTKRVSAYLKPVTESAIEESAIESYFKWRSEVDESVLNAKRIELVNGISALLEGKANAVAMKAKALEELKAKSLKERHKAFLLERGLPDNGLRPSTKTRPHRVAHCWNCKTDLDSKVLFECATCAWILCECGACGCGYPRN